jgi:hypothetical protein
MRKQVLAFVALLAAYVALAAPRGHEHTAAATAASAAGQVPSERPRGNEGRLPPSPTKRPEGTEPEAEHVAGNRTDNTPHVDHDHWYGHDRPEDPRYTLVTPFVHGRFANFGPGYRYRVAKVDLNRHLIWFPGDAEFRVADWDWPIWMEWCSDCGNDFVVYPDPDHDGWYLLYNVHVAGYVHVEYMGVDTE